MLVLRGPQTFGEIKGRSERIYDWSDLDETETVVRKMMEREEPLVQRLDPAPGMKEPRYAQTLAGVVDIASAPGPAHAGVSPDCLATLEAEVSQLREEVAELRRRLESVL